MGIFKACAAVIPFIIVYIFCVSSNLSFLSTYSSFLFAIFLTSSFCAIKFTILKKLFILSSNKFAVNFILLSVYFSILLVEYLTSNIKLYIASINNGITPTIKKVVCSFFLKV
ncbi:hypothetical protein D3C81_419130 [compost metagenome]